MIENIIISEQIEVYALQIDEVTDDVTISVQEIVEQYSISIEEIGLQGIQGEIGLTGPQGLQGIKGDKGDKGDAGLQGIQGIQGIQGEIGLTGSQGIQGLKGDKGDTGSQGIQGEIGLTGKSAYQSALDGGFVGTELEFNQFLSEVDQKLNISDYNDRFKGVFLTLEALNLAHPTGIAGDSAQVNEVGATDVVNYSWDDEENIWVQSGASGSAATNTDVLPEGTSNLYFTTARVLSTFINGVSFLIGTPIVSTDSILVALGKLQKQINDNLVSIGLKQNTLTNPLTGVGSELDPNTYALQDGTVLYHSAKWFVPSGAVSTIGTKVTSVGTQFTSAMVGAKLTINGEWRVITAYTNATNVTVASAYSQNYSNVVAGNWGVYSMCLSITSTGYVYYYNYQGIVMFTYVPFDQFNVRFSGFSTTGNEVAIQPGGASLKNSARLLWSSDGTYYGTKDLGLRRNSAGVLEIYDGITLTGLEANRRDLLVRNVTVSQYKLNALNTAPASATAIGVLGEIRYDANYMYVCTATNTWKRSALTTW